jgi:hypothetical protein
MDDTAGKEEGASVGFIRFMSEQYPCNKGSQDARAECLPQPMVACAEGHHLPAF